MENRYLYRAKRIDNGEWLYGDLLHGNSGVCYICSQYTELDDFIQAHAFEVDPSTICQCTGQPDKNKKLIYEGDIISTPVGDATVKFGESEHNGLIHYGTHIRFINGDDDDTYRHDFGWWYAKSRVLGNIFDNPELLEVE